MTTKVREFSVGDVVNVRSEIGRRSKIAELRTSSSGMQLYILADGGWMGADELELDRYQPIASKPRVARIPLYACLECGRKFYSTRAAEKASFGDDGCPGCGGSDIDLYVSR